MSEMNESEMGSDQQNAEVCCQTETPVTEAALTTEVVQALQSMPGMLAAVGERLTALEELFKQRLVYDEVKENAFNCLYKRMKQAETDLQSSLKKGLIRSLLLLYDDIAKTEEELEPENPTRRMVAYLKEQLLRIFYTEGVEPMGDLGIKFDPPKQRSVDRSIATDPEKDMTVERVTREGFWQDGKVLRQQDVIVRRYEQDKGEK